MWRCISRIDYGTKYCHDSPTLPEGPLQDAILAAINSAMSRRAVLVEQITDAMRMELVSIPGESMSLSDIDRRLGELDSEFRELFAASKEDGGYLKYVEAFKRITEDMAALKEKRASIMVQQENDSATSRRIQDAVNVLNAGSAEITEWGEDMIRWMLRGLPVEDWHGGKVQRVRPNILHLMRGQLYDIEGRTFFTMGGATSHDVEDGILDPNAPDFRAQYIHLLFGRRRRFRIIGKSWWPEELPSDEEYAEAMETLERAGGKADYVITHCAPTRIAQQINRHYQPDALTDFLELVKNRLEFGCWLFGQYHNNHTIDPKHVLLRENIIQLL